MKTTLPSCPSSPSPAFHKRCLILLWSCLQFKLWVPGLLKVCLDHQHQRHPRADSCFRPTPCRWTKPEALHLNQKSSNLNFHPPSRAFCILTSGNHLVMWRNVLAFYFAMISNLQKHCEHNTKDCGTSFTQIHQFLTLLSSLQSLTPRLFSPSFLWTVWDEVAHCLT